MHFLSIFRVGMLSLFIFCIVKNFSCEDDTEYARCQFLGSMKNHQFYFPLLKTETPCTDFFGRVMNTGGSHSFSLEEDGVMVRYFSDNNCKNLEYPNVFKFGHVNRGDYSIFNNTIFDFVGEFPRDLSSLDSGQFVAFHGFDNGLQPCSSKSYSASVILKTGVAIGEYEYRARCNSSFYLTEIPMLGIAKHVSIKKVIIFKEGSCYESGIFDFNHGQKNIVYECSMDPHYVSKIKKTCSDQIDQFHIDLFPRATKCQSSLIAQLYIKNGMCVQGNKYLDLIFGKNIVENIHGFFGLDLKKLALTQSFANTLSIGPVADVKEVEVVEVYGPISCSQTSKTTETPSVVKVSNVLCEEVQGFSNRFLGDKSKKMVKGQESSSFVAGISVPSCDLNEKELEKYIIEASKSPDPYYEGISLQTCYNPDYPLFGQFNGRNISGVTFDSCKKYDMKYTIYDGHHCDTEQPWHRYKGKLCLDNTNFNGKASLFLCMPYVCFDKLATDKKVCGGRGRCIETDKCKCNVWTARGEKCQSYSALVFVISIGVPVLVYVSCTIIFCCCFIIVCCCCCCFGACCICRRIRSRKKEETAPLDEKTSLRRSLLDGEWYDDYDEYVNRVIEPSSRKNVVSVEPGENSPSPVTPQKLGEGPWRPPGSVDPPEPVEPQDPSSTVVSSSIARGPDDQIPKDENAEGDQGKERAEKPPEASLPLPQVIIDGIVMAERIGPLKHEESEGEYGDEMTTEELKRLIQGSKSLDPIGIDSQNTSSSAPNTRTHVTQGGSFTANSPNGLGPSSLPPMFQTDPKSSTASSTNVFDYLSGEPINPIVLVTTEVGVGIRLRKVKKISNRILDPVEPGIVKIEKNDITNLKFRLRHAQFYGDINLNNICYLGKGNYGYTFKCGLIKENGEYVLKVPKCDEKVIACSYEDGIRFSYHYNLVMILRFFKNDRMPNNQNSNENLVIQTEDLFGIGKGRKPKNYREQKKIMKELIKWKFLKPELSRHPMFLMKFHNTDLLSFLERERGGKICVPDILWILHGMVSGGNHLFKEKIIHRDIHLENVFVHRTEIKDPKFKYKVFENRILIGDYGCALDRRSANDGERWWRVPVEMRTYSQVVIVGHSRMYYSLCGCYYPPEIRIFCGDTPAHLPPPEHDDGNIVYMDLSTCDSYAIGVVGMVLLGLYSYKQQGQRTFNFTLQVNKEDEKERRILRWIRAFAFGMCAEDPEMRIRFANGVAVTIINRLLSLLTEAKDYSDEVLLSLFPGEKMPVDPRKLRTRKREKKKN